MLSKRRSVFTYEQLQMDPYPVFHGLRKLDPVFYSPSWNAWFVTGYDEVAAALRLPGLSVRHRILQLPLRLGSELIDCLPAIHRIIASLSAMMLFSDPPQHTRLRALVNKAFTPKSVEQMGEAIQKRVEKLFASCREGSVIDILEAIGNPLPVLTMMDFLGSREDDEALLLGCSHDLASFLGEVGVISREQIRQGDESILKMRAYFGEVIGERRRRPTNDLISRLISAKAGGLQLSDEEIKLMCMVMFGAGQDTTANMIGNGILAFLEHPEECRALVERPELIDRAVDEVLRYDGPLQVIHRFSVENVVLGGKAIEAGSPIFICLGGANRDPARFPEPDRFSLSRSEDFPHMALGWGIHFCVGTFLAKLQVRTVFQMFLERYPRSRLAGPPERCPSVAFRRLNTLPVELLA